MTGQLANQVRVRTMEGHVSVADQWGASIWGHVCRMKKSRGPARRYLEM